MEDDQKALVPRLRFPEFCDAEEWTERALRSFGKIITGKTPSTKNKKLWNGDVPFITPTDISEGTKYLLVTERYVSKSEKLNLLPAGSVLYVCIASIGKMAITAEESITNQQINAVVPYSDENGEFIFYSLRNLTPWIKSIPASSTLAIINKSEFSGFVLTTPNADEQQKIADCLTAIDERITAIDARIDAIKAHKKGLMQQLFPREGDTTPRLRFPEFRDAGEWDECQLCELARFSSGGTPSKRNANFWNGTVPWISASSMHVTKISRSGLNVTQLAIGNGTRIAKQGSLLILVRGSMLFKRVPIGIAMTDVAFNQDVKALDVNEELSRVFLLNQLIAISPRIPIRETGIGAGKIDTETLNELKIGVPAVNEQQKIADCLSSLDELIAATTAQRDALREHKKGMMQQLFPSPAEADA